MKRITTAGLICLLAGSLFSCKTDPEYDTLTYQELREGFENPKGSALPKVYWWWLNGYTDSLRIVEELRSMKNAGIGGVDIYEIGIQPASDPEKLIPAGPPFMSDSSVKAIKLAVTEAGRLGMEVGLGLASSWNAGGSWVTPEHAAKTIYYAQTTFKPAEDGTMVLPFPEITPDRNGQPRKIAYDPDGKPVYWEDIAVVAVPAGSASLRDTSAVVNLSPYFDSKTGVLTWNGQEGGSTQEWDIYRFICSNSGEQLIRPSPGSAGPIIDHFDAEATEMHVRYFAEKLREALGDLSMSALKYFYLASYEAKEFAWTSTLPAKFRELHGYDLYKYLPVLFRPEIFREEGLDQFRHDFLKTFSELMIHNHYRKAREICHEYGLQIISEAGGPGHMHHVPAETLKALGSLDIPRGEYWYNREYFKEDSLVDYIWLVKEIAAASHIYKRKIVEEEAFTSYWDWQEGPGNLKNIADRAFCEGMNRVVIHGFTHNPAEFGNPGIVYWAGTHFNDKRVWWPKVKPFNQYLARISHVLQNTRFFADVLYYYGDDIPNLVPPKNTRFKVGDGYDYEIVNTEIVLNDLEVEKGEWVLPGVGRYKVLSLGKGHRTHPGAMDKINQLARKGAKIAGQDIVSELGLVPDFTYTHHADSLLDFIHFQAADADFYLIRNNTRQTVTQNCSFRQPGKTPELWHPETGRIHDITVWEDSDRQIRLPLTFKPWETYFVVFTNRRSSPHFERLESEGPSLPALAYTRHGIQLLDDATYQFVRHGRSSEVHNAVKRIPLDKPWEVSFHQGEAFSAQFPQLISWTESSDPKIKYYSGIAVYETKFEIPEIDPAYRYYLDLGRLAEVGELWVNGQPLGITWTQSHRFDITENIRTGQNTLKVEIANTWSNRLTGDGITGEKFTQTNLVKANKNLVLWKDLPLKESGLLGPVEIVQIKQMEP